jgi:vancomycin resistance protein YoaR
MQTTLYPPSAGPISRPRLHRSIFDLIGLLALLAIFVLVSTTAIWQFWHANRIYGGVTIGGIGVGGLTRAEALKLVNQELYAYPLPPVTVEYQGQQWPLQTMQVQANADLLAAVNQAYLVGRQGPFLVNLVEQARTALGGHAIAPPLTFDPAPLRSTLEQIAARVEKSPVAARTIGSVAVPAQAGLSIDVDTTLQAVAAALRGTDLHATAVVPLAASAVAAPEAAAASDPKAGTALPAVAAVQQPLVLRAESSGLEIALDPARLAQLLVSTEPLQVDEAGLRAYLDEVAKQVNVPARDARLRFNPDTGGVTVLQTSTPGRELDVDATVQAVQQALTSGSAQAPLALAETAAAVDSNKIAEMGIRELVATGTTYYAGSSASRVYNIEVAAEKFDGVVVPPNGVFSFNDVVRDVSSANGFEDGLVIWGDRTAVGVGGGVCQVSTTIFRTAYEGGFPIVARTNHGYVVDWYGKPGLDATIFTPYVDFQFRNDTGAYLLFEPVVDSANGVITFNFYGTRPDRNVTISEPVISDVKDPEPPQYVVDESLAKDEKKQVDWEKQGMTATVTRTIVENGTTRTDTLVSKYEPWRAVFTVGPGTDIPATPTPAATPAATTTPTAAP